MTDAQMLALVKTARGEGFVELREVPVPKIGSGEVLIEVKAVGICGTDIHIYHDQHRYWPPVVLGHEFAGQIVAKADDVTGYQVGDRVVAEPHTQACGVCYNCCQGHREVCARKRSPGWGIDGAMAKYLKMPAVLLHRIPEQLSYEEAALMEPAAVAYQAVFLRGEMRPGEFAVVIGPGVIGLLCALMARTVAAREVVITGTPRSAIRRLALARRLGLRTINIGEQDPVTEVLRLTDGIGADIVIDTSGADSAINQAVAMIRTRGRLIGVGITGKQQIPIAWDEAAYKACDFRFSFSSCYDAWEGAIRLLGSRKLDVRPLISHQVALRDWQEAFRAIEEREAVKCLLIP